jgi:hypothetical protein
MRTIFLAAAFVVVSFVTIGQTMESPRVLGKGEQMNTMEWYKQPDGKLMMMGSSNEIDRYVNDLLDFYGLDDRESNKGVRVWRAITKQFFSIEMVVSIGDYTGVIVVDKN